MNCDRGFSHSLASDGACLLRIRGELPIWGHLRATNLYAVGSFDPDHDAVMRIGGEAPGGGPILSVGICAMSTAGSRHLGSSIGSPPKKPARAPSR